MVQMAAAVRVVPALKVNVATPVVRHAPVPPRALVRAAVTMAAADSAVQGVILAHLASMALVVRRAVVLKMAALWSVVMMGVGGAAVIAAPLRYVALKVCACLND